MVRASDSGSVCCFLEQETFTPQKVLVIPRNRWLRLNMTEKLFTGTLNKNQNKTKSSSAYPSTKLRDKRNKALNVLFKCTGTVQERMYVIIQVCLLDSCTQNICFKSKKKMMTFNDSCYEKTCLCCFQVGKTLFCSASETS